VGIGVIAVDCSDSSDCRDFSGRPVQVGEHRIAGPARRRAVHVIAKLRRRIGRPQCENLFDNDR
jgi:hypothetical protein